MATTVTYCNSFKDELLRGIHDFSTDQFKVALYQGDGTAVTKATSSYAVGTPPNELAAGNGYALGGMNLQKLAGGAGADLILAVNNADVAAADFVNAVFAAMTASGIRQALIYNSTKQNRACVFVTWDAPGRGATAADFTVTLPSDAAAGVIRIGP